MRMRIKIALTLAVVGVGVGYMIFTTLRSGSALEYFKHVEEVVAELPRWRGRRLQIHGNVVAGSILKRPGALDYRFALHRGGRWLEVTYAGMVPDTFRDCSELVVTGRLTDDRTLVAEGLSAKCPSKYDDRRHKTCGETLRAAVAASRARQGR